MVRLKVTDATYQPHQESTALIPISSPLYDGDYIEVYADGSGQIVRTMGSVTIDGNTMPMTNTDGYKTNGLNYAYYFENKRKKEQNKLFSTIGLGSATDGIEGVRLNPLNTTISVVLSDDKTGITSSDTNTTIVSKINTWLQYNPVTVVYELATPTTEPLTAEQVAEFMKLRTYKTTTHINADGEKVVRYVVDTKTYIDNKFAELQALMNV